ncbi:MAG: LON peptidase substrate-binding domain-containing protein [Ignavibacteria bacterium]|nr:LON peptidase substrate-binding domain-containing protein [Ignavibacteria bacterium]
MEENIPFFPLGIVVLPGETRFLHIFEKKYRNLYEDIESNGGYFGIPFIHTGNVEQAGSLVKLEKVLVKYPNGELDIAVKGVDIFNILKYYDEHPERFYPFGNLELLNKGKIEPSKQLLDAFNKYNKLVLKLDLEKLPKPGFYLIANSVGLTEIEKFNLLLQGSEKALNTTMTNHVNLRTLLALQKDSVHEYYCLN